MHSLTIMLKLRTGFLIKENANFIKHINVEFHAFNDRINFSFYLIGS